MHGTEDDNMPSGSGNLANALDHIAGEGFDDDFLTGDDVTIAQIHSLASSKPSGPISTPPAVMVPEQINDSTFSLPTPSPRTFPEPTEASAAATPMNTATLPSPGRTTSNTSSMVSSDAGGPLIVSPLPKVSPRSNMSSPGRKPKSFTEASSLSNGGGTTTASGASRRPSGSGGLPRVALLAANKPTPKREEPQRGTPPPFRAGGSGVRPGSSSASGSGRGRTPPPTATTTSNRVSASSSPVPGAGGPATSTGGVSRSSSRSSIASGSSSSRLATSSSTSSRPTWGSTSGAAAPVARTSSARSTSTATGSGGGATRIPGTGVRSSSQRLSTPPPAGGARAGTTTTAAATRRTVSTSSAASAGAGRGRVVARSSSPTKIPGVPARSTSVRSTNTRPGAATAAAAGAVAATAAGAAALVGKSVVEEQSEEDPLDTLVSLMGELKDIRHELDMATPTGANGAENPEFGSAQIEAEDSLPGPEFVASVDNTGTAVEDGEDGVVVDSLEKKESAAGGKEESGRESGTAVDGTSEGQIDAAHESSIEKLDYSDVVVVHDEPVVVVEEPPVAGPVRPAFEQQSWEQEKIQAKPLCSCSIM